MSLSYDMARCSGNGRDACKDCRRREPGNYRLQSFILPAATESGCDHHVPHILAHTSIEGMDDMADNMEWIIRSM